MWPSGLWHWHGTKEKAMLTDTSLGTERRSLSPRKHFLGFHLLESICGQSMEHLVVSGRQKISITCCDCIKGYERLEGGVRGGGEREGTASRVLILFLRRFLLNPKKALRMERSRKSSCRLTQ